MNAVKHGLLSHGVLLPGEDAEALRAFGDAMRQQLAPVGELEELLADHVIASAWRLRRVTDIEVNLLNSGMEVNFFDVVVSGRRRLDLGEAFKKDAHGDNCLGKLSRYESAIQRGMYRALHELQRLQAVRAGEPVPAPVAVDVTVNGGFVSQNRPFATELPDLL